jgi:hypothetical protein
MNWTLSKALKTLWVQFLITFESIGSDPDGDLYQIENLEPAYDDWNPYY